MAPRLKISSNVIERLGKVGETSTGRLYGVLYDNTLMVLAFSLDIADENGVTVDYTALQLSMPVEVDLCGVLRIGNCEDGIPHAFEDVDVTDNPLLLKCSLGGTELQPYFYIHQKLEAAVTTEVLTEQDIWQQLAYVRLEATIPIVTHEENVLDALQQARKNIASGKVGFYFPRNNIYLLGAENDSKDSSADELLQATGANVYEGVGNNKNNPKCIPEIVDAIPADMFLKSTKDRLLEGDIKYAPVLQHIKRPFQCLEFDLKVDALSLVNRNVSTARLYVILVESVCRNLKLTEQSLKEQLANGGSIMKPSEPMHFKPRGCGHILTLIRTAGTSDEETLEHRKSLHKVLALDTDRPCFRKGNALQFQDDLDKNKPLLNPHEAIQIAGVPGGKVSVVDGLYSYHHYMQDQFDDNGWGCAYRSLQTIVSWYRLQGYTEKPIPTHRDVQKCLVDIGDKPSSFIGSKQWIGSTEVGFVLETLLGISIKVLCASTGEEMSTLATSLAYHFQHQGTPVMIGGGVLAHTILGVDYNESSSEIKFLILDPHYTGSEQITTILNKGWCGWKTKDFWKKDAFYNMCLPQRPICI